MEIYEEHRAILESFRGRDLASATRLLRKKNRLTCVAADDRPPWTKAAPMPSNYDHNLNPQISKFIPVIF